MALPGNGAPNHFPLLLSPASSFLCSCAAPIAVSDLPAYTHFAAHSLFTSQQVYMVCMAPALSARDKISREMWRASWARSLGTRMCPLRTQGKGSDGQVATLGQHPPPHPLTFPRCPRCCTDCANSVSWLAATVGQHPLLSAYLLPPMSPLYCSPSAADTIS